MKIVLMLLLMLVTISAVAQVPLVDLTQDFQIKNGTGDWQTIPAVSAVFKSGTVGYPKIYALAGLTRWQAESPDSTVDAPKILEFVLDIRFPKMISRISVRCRYRVVDAGETLVADWSEPSDYVIIFKKLVGKPALVQ